MTNTKSILPSELVVLAERIKLLNMSFNASGFGSRSVAAEWLIKNGHETGGVKYVARKIAHILKGYVRGIRPSFAKNGGLWSPSEAARVASALYTYIEENHTGTIAFTCTDNSKTVVKVVRRDSN